MEAENLEPLEICWKGYCPECWLKGTRSRMQLNHWDLYECESCRLQIGVLANGIRAVVLNFRGKGKFRLNAVYADEECGGEFLGPQVMEMPPFGDTTFFSEPTDLINYIQTIE